jgi:hypothetical protein
MVHSPVAGGVIMTTEELASRQGEMYANAIGVSREEGCKKLRWFARSILAGMQDNSRQHFPLPTDNVDMQKTLVIEKLDKQTFRFSIEFD